MCVIWSERKKRYRRGTYYRRYANHLGPGLTAQLKDSLFISWVIHTFVFDQFSGEMRQGGGSVLSRVPDLNNRQRVLGVAVRDDSENAEV